MSWHVIENVSEIPSPSLLIYPDRVRENLRLMVEMVGTPDRLRPHVKTHKLPQIIAIKRDVGISKFKCSTIAECEMTATAGGEDILLAYQLVGPNIARFLTLQARFPQTRFSALVDDPGVARAISEAATAAKTSVELLLDVNIGMNRTGIEPEDEAFALYKSLTKLSGLKAGGLHLYDGHVNHVDLEERQRFWNTMIKFAWEFRDRVLAAGLPIPRIVGGGTPTLSYFAKVPDVECSAGTTVLWDAGEKQKCADLPFLNAAVLLTRVVSKPSKTRLCLDLGHKAVASEMPHPRLELLDIDANAFVAHSEEHLILTTRYARDYQVGDVFYGLPRHICPTVALHQQVYVVRNGRADEVWPVVARARILTI